MDRLISTVMAKSTMDLKKLSFGAVFGRGADETIPEPKVEINPITADDAREMDLIS